MNGVFKKDEQIVFMEMVANTKSDESVNSRMCQEILCLRGEIEQLRKERDELADAHWPIARKAALLAIDRCKSATGQSRQIDMYVSANQCAEDTLLSLEKTRERK